MKPLFTFVEFTHSNRAQPHLLDAPKTEDSELIAGELAEVRHWTKMLELAFNAESPVSDTAARREAIANLAVSLDALADLTIQKVEGSALGDLLERAIAERDKANYAEYCDTLS